MHWIWSDSFFQGLRLIGQGRNPIFSCFYSILVYSQRLEIGAAHGIHLEKEHACTEHGHSVAVSCLSYLFFSFPKYDLGRYQWALRGYEKLASSDTRRDMCYVPTYTLEEVWKHLTIHSSHCTNGSYSQLVYREKNAEKKSTNPNVIFPIYLDKGKACS